jgi:hypothetical protein
MKITVDIKRLVLTMTACMVAAMLPLIITTTERLYPFLVPLFFSFAITLTNFDRIKTKRKYQAFVLTALLTTISFFISVMFGLYLGTSFGDYGIFIMCLLSGLVTVLIFSVVLQIDNLKFGLVTTGLLALTTPYLTKQLSGREILNFEFSGDPAIFFTIWQIIIGLALAITIWTKKIGKTQK